MKITVRSLGAGNPRINASYKIEDITFNGTNADGEHGCDIKLKEIGTNGKVKRKKQRQSGGRT